MVYKYCCILVGLMWDLFLIDILLFVSMKKEDNWNDISFIIRSKHRREILNLLDKPQTPTQIKEETKLHFNSVSRTLIELEKKGFIMCLNPSQKLIRFYQITKKGKNLLEKVKEVG